MWLILLSVFCPWAIGHHFFQGCFDFSANILISFVIRVQFLPAVALISKAYVLFPKSAVKVGQNIDMR